jgi:hypothetical protein
MTAATIRWAEFEVQREHADISAHGRCVYCGTEAHNYHHRFTNRELVLVCRRCHQLQHLFKDAIKEAKAKEIK